ncbi:transcriptional regulator SlyA [compost metagenome]
MDNQHQNNGSLLLGRLFLQLRQLEREPRTFGNIGPLTPGEIHTIDAIGLEGGLLMSELAARLGITKGAVTQLISRLEAKKLVKRASLVHDSRASVITLTEQGREAYTAHEEAHLEFYNRLREQVSEEEIIVFEKCIEKLSSLLKK